MGGLLEISKTLKVKGNINEGTDYDIITENGVYSIRSSSNTNNGPGIGWGLLFVISNFQKVQIAFEGLGGFIKWRTNNSTVWSKWYKMIGVEDA